MKSLNPGITDWHGKRVWIIGASHGIGAALVHQLRGAGAHLMLSSRHEAALRELATPGELVAPLDVRDSAALQGSLEQMMAQAGGVDLVIYAAGVYTPMRSWELDPLRVRETLEVNLQGVYNMLGAVLHHLLETGGGGICLLASVAGYTGLPKAMAYGPSKAALINLAQILHTDLAPRGIGVYLVNPGFVDTRLTRQNDFTMPALITPEGAAREILAGIGKGHFEIHFPKRFTRWMKLLSCLPDRLRLYLLRKAVA